MKLKGKVIMAINRTFLVVGVATVFFLFSLSAASAQSCCSNPSDCPPLQGYVARCSAHSSACPVRVCVYEAGTVGGPDIDWFGLQLQSASRFTNQSIGIVISTLLRYILPFAGLLLLLYLIYGGYRYMLSQGDPKTLQEAKSVITTALLGFVIVFISFWLVQIVGTALGLDIIANIF